METFMESVSPTSAKLSSDSLTLALLIMDFTTDSRARAVWAGIADAAREQQSRAICFTAGTLHVPKAMRENRRAVIWELANPEQFDGLLTFQWWYTSEWFETVCGRCRPKPIVQIWGKPVTKYHIIGDYETDMRMQLRHLYEVHGYRRIAYVPGFEGAPAEVARRRVYDEMIATGRLAVDSSLLLSFDSNLDGLKKHGEEAVRSLFDERRLRPGTDIEAIVAFNDAMALGVLEALQARGIQVPADVAVVGFDDRQEARLTHPPLTTMRVSWYQVGRRAAETLLRRLRGEAEPDVIHIPSTFIARRSCGCFSQSVMDAGHGRFQGTAARPFEEALGSQRDQAIDRMAGALDDAVWSSIPNWAEQMFDAFAAAMTAESLSAASKIFLSALEELLYQVGRQGGEPGIALHILTILQTYALRCLVPDNPRSTRLEKLMAQACVLVGEIAVWAKEHAQVEQERLADRVRSVGQQIISTFDMRNVMDVLAENLPLLGIPGCFLSLYDDRAKPAAGCRLMLAYTHAGRVPLPHKGRAFPSGEFIPKDLLPRNYQGSFVVEPLYFEDSPIGIAVFEEGPQDRQIYDILCGEISGALQGALLLGELTRQKYILDTFMENVPDSIYFKDRESRIFHANAAHAGKMGLEEPSAEYGKTDFDFFSEEEARPKYEQEQEIIRSGQPLMNIEEPHGEHLWLLTTKMPLRNEHGDIIGTFGISRDITDLKKAQQAVEQRSLELSAAYEEIRILNEQLHGENVRMGAELDISRRIQQMLLPPPEELQEIAGLDIAGFMRPADEVGGDYYDIFAQNGHVHIGIGDVTGHGLESGILMLMTQTTIRAIVNHDEHDPAVFLNTLNRTLYQNIQRMNTERTLSLSLLNYYEGQLSIIGQHEDVLVVRKNGRVERIDTADLGFPLGLVENIAQWVAEARIDLQPGDGVVLYTDGITEAANIGNEHYGLERLCEALNRHWGKSSVKEIQKAVIDELLKFIGEQKVHDDLTLVILRQQ